MGKPDEWAKILEGPPHKMSGIASTLRTRGNKGLLPGTEAGDWEVTSRVIGDDKAAVYVVYRKKAKK